MLLLRVNVGYMKDQSDVRASTRLALLAGCWSIDKKGQHRNHTHIGVHGIVRAKLYFLFFFAPFRIRTTKQQVVNTCREHFVSVRKITDGSQIWRIIKTRVVFKLS